MDRWIDTLGKPEVTLYADIFIIEEKGLGE
jgi:hypothetical protein